ncbi:MAG: 4-hydroxy-3-methylbut-2-enyl diphosphate reductase [Sphingobacteriaceae bacterium]|nr:4-hydroxy-3-methylbut-2-enyl diphosphate reductase [Sphingobacteriaceae bacterium]
MKTFNVPEFYRSPVITAVKQFFKNQDPRKKDMRPAHLNFGKVNYFIARHFGFCYGVENAIEIAFKALDENPGKNIFLLSQMIHNPDVNNDLTERGVQFLQDTLGKNLISFDVLKSDDVVIIPAFGAPLPLIELLEKKGIRTEAYNTTCPFVERVWKKSEQIGQNNHTIIIHGKYNHEETRSTFSRSANHSKAVVVVKDLKEAQVLAQYILGNGKQQDFESDFKNKCSLEFDIQKHFNKIGVINQTTMLATETEEIANYLKGVMEQKFGSDKIKEHFADTRDTLCYATNENQNATLGLLETDADLAIVVGGYNSSNTSHLVELCERKFPTYFISSAKEITSLNEINHFNYLTKEMKVTKDFLPQKPNLNIVISSGASCPDSLLEEVILRINELLKVQQSVDEAIQNIKLYSN